MNRFICMLSVLLAVAACSRDDGMPSEQTRHSGAVEMLAGFGGTDVGATPAARSGNTSPFTQPFDIFLTQTAPQTGDYLLAAGKYDVARSGGVFTLKEENKTIYWDDIGGVDATLTFVAVYPKESTGLNPKIIDPTTDTTFDFEVKADQKTEGNFTASDLLVSDWVVNYSVSTQKAALPTKVMFRHLLSKITFNVSQGNGFAVGETFDPELSVVFPFDRKGTVNVPTAASGDKAAVSTASVQQPTGNMTPHQTDLTFELVVMPEQTINGGDELAKATVVTGSGASNTYSIKATNAVTLDPGKNYIFNVTLNKTDGQVLSTKIVDWEKVQVDEGNDVQIEVEEGDDEKNSVKLRDGASFLLSVDSKKTIYKYSKPEDIESEGESVGEWGAPDPPIYWDDIKRDSELVARGVLYNNNGNLSETLDPEDIYVGQTTPGKLASAVEYIHFKDMTHPFAKVNLVIKTPAEPAPERVDLSEISSIVFHDMKKFSGLGTSVGLPNFLTISYEETAAALTGTDGAPQTGSGDEFNYFNAVPIYIAPVTVEAGTLLTVTLTKVDAINGNLLNVYPMKITAPATFAAAHEYTVTLTLKKTEIAEVGVEMKPWTTVETPISGEGSIDK